MKSCQFQTTRIKTGKDDRLLYVVPTQHKNYIWNYIKTLEKKHALYIIRLSTPFRPRTTGRYSQCAAFNGWCQQIAEETGNDFYHVKMYCKNQAISQGYPLEKDESGKIKYNLYGEVIPQSEAKAAVEEAKILIDVVIQLAAERNILLKGFNENR